MADDVRSLVVAMEARIGQYERSMARAQAKTNQVAGRIESRFHTLNGSVTRSMTMMGRTVRGALATLGVGLGATAFTSLVRGSLEAAEAINDMAERANVGAEFLQEMHFAAGRFGATSRDVNDAMSRLNRRLGLFINDGAGPGAVAFRALGLESRIASGEIRDAESVFWAAMEAMEGIENAAQRAAIASGLFGEDAGPRLAALVGQGVSGLNELRVAAREAGVVLGEDLVRQGAEANRTMREIGQAVGAEATAAVLEHAESLTQLAEGFGTVASWAIRAAAAIPEFSNALAEAIYEWGVINNLPGFRPPQVIGAQDPRAQGLAYGELADRLDEASFNAREFLETLREIGAIEANAIADQFQAALESGRPLNDLLDEMQGRLRSLSESRIDLANRADLEWLIDFMNDPFRSLGPDRGGNSQSGGGPGRAAAPDLPAPIEIETRTRAAPTSEVADPQKSLFADRYGKYREGGESVRDISELIKEDLERLQASMRSDFGKAFADAMMTGDVQGAVQALFQSAAQRGLTQIGEAVFDSLFGGLFDTAAAATTGATQGQAAAIPIGTAMTASGATAAAQISSAMTAAGATVASQIAASMASGGGKAGGGKGDLGAILGGIIGSFFGMPQLGAAAGSVAFDGAQIKTVGSQIGTAIAPVIPSPQAMRPSVSIPAGAASAARMPPVTIKLEAVEGEMFELRVKDIAGPMAAEATVTAVHQSRNDLTAMRKRAGQRLR